MLMVNVTGRYAVSIETFSHIKSILPQLPTVYCSSLVTNISTLGSSHLPIFLKVNLIYALKFFTILNFCQFGDMHFLFYSGFCPRSTGY